MLDDGQFVRFKRKRFRNTRHRVTFEITIVKPFLKHPASPLEVTLNRNYLR
jgi:hypothetical protein